jgi:predicted AlkP superfamily pyrophosphatase or phosphodiesterase
MQSLIRLMMGSLAVLAVCALPSSVLAQDTELASGTGQPITILVALDGFKPDYLDRGITPNLKALADHGVRGSMQPSFPAVTFPNLYTLMTGKRPDRHGVVGNRFEDETRTFVLGDDRSRTRDPHWWNQALPIWASAEAQGVRTANLFYFIPGVDAAGQYPALYRDYDPNLAPSDEPGELLKWLDSPLVDRPRFMTLYFYPTDREGHAHGPNSAELNSAVAEVDRAIGELVNGLRQRDLLELTNIVLVADHGMAEVPTDQRILLDALIDPAAIRPVSLGAFAAIEPAPGTTVETLATKLVGRHGHMECWRKEQIPPRFHFGGHPRIAPLICLADKGWIITTLAESEVAAAPAGEVRGDHGYDPGDPDMAAVFVGYGPAFRQGIELPKFENVDVYFLLAHLLGVRPEPGDGSAAVFQPALLPR